MWGAWGQTKRTGASNAPLVEPAVEGVGGAGRDDADLEVPERQGDHVEHGVAEEADDAGLDGRLLDDLGGGGDKGGGVGV